MLDCEMFYQTIEDAGLSFYAGVPDSLLKNFCAYVTDHAKPENNVIAANEGNAIGLAAGHFLATGKPGVVYMQNSGLGNTVNPLTSLADKSVYGIPMLMIVGWRGEPGVKDAPQHTKMGEVTPGILDAMGIEWKELPTEEGAAKDLIAYAKTRMEEVAAPFALLVRKNTFAKYVLQTETPAPYEMTRERAIQVMVEQLSEDAHVVATTGMPSRELYETRKHFEQSEERDFLTVGSMGHANQIALGIALADPTKKIYALDGDGAALMHMGTLPIIAASKCKNFKHIVVNNGAHDSVGGQPTVAFQASLSEVARASGYPAVFTAKSEEELRDMFSAFDAAEGPAFLEVMVKVGHRDDLSRPSLPPRELKHVFMASLKTR